MKKLSLAVLALSLLSAETKCPTPFTEFNRACHYIGTDSVASRHVALAHCQALGGYLANLNSELEANYTMDKIKQLQHGMTLSYL